MIRTMLTAAILSGCVADSVALGPKAKMVMVGKGDPASNFSLVGPITAKHGSGCGLYGEKGDYDGAVNKLRVQAAHMGADYVSITTVREPHDELNCRVNAYVVTGMAYRKTADSPAPIPVHVRVQTDPAPRADVVEKLRQLEELHQSGALTDEEFARAKSRLLQ